MSTLTADRPRTLTSASTRRRITALPAAILGSRLLIFAGALAGTLFPRVSSWRLADPQRVTTSFGSVGNVLAAASVRWDSLHYLAVAQHGYTKAANTVFFPLYPLLIRVLAYVTRSDVIAGTAISLAAFATALLLLHRLARDELGERVADASVLLLAFSPFSLFFTAIYTESLFLALALATFTLARRNRFGWACLAATAATLTHAEGVLLLAPLAVFYLQRPQSPRLITAAPLLAPGAALTGFLVYLRANGYGWLAPSSNQRLYSRHFTGPIRGIAEGAKAGVTGLVHLLNGSAASLTQRQNAFENVIYLVVLLISVAALVAAWRQLPKPYVLYSALVLLVCVSSPETTGQPLTSLNRFVLVLFPLWMIAARWLSERRVLRATLAGSATLAFIFALEFARWVFFG